MSRSESSRYITPPFRANLLKKQWLKVGNSSTTRKERNTFLVLLFNTPADGERILVSKCCVHDKNGTDWLVPKVSLHSSFDKKNILAKISKQS